MSRDEEQYTHFKREFEERLLVALAAGESSLTVEVSGLIGGSYQWALVAASRALEQHLSAAGLVVTDYDLEAPVGSAKLTVRFGDRQDAASESGLVEERGHDVATVLEALKTFAGITDG